MTRWSMTRIHCAGWRLRLGTIVRRSIWRLFLYLNLIRMTRSASMAIFLLENMHSSSFECHNSTTDGQEDLWSSAGVKFWVLTKSVENFPSIRNGRNDSRDRLSTRDYICQRVSGDIISSRSIEAQSGPLLRNYLKGWSICHWVIGSQHHYFYLLSLWP